MITISQIGKLELNFGGKLWYKTASANVKPNLLELNFGGKLWWGHSGAQTVEETTTYSGNIKRVSKVLWGYIKKTTKVSGW